MSLTAALGEFALGGLDDSDSLSVPDPLLPLLAQPLADRDYLLRAQPVDNLSGLLFDGSGGISVLAGQSANSPVGSGTWEAWIYLTSTPTVQMPIFSHQVSGGTARERMLSVTAGSKLQFTARNDAGTLYTNTGNTPLQLNTWYHVAGVLDVPSLLTHIYVNGVEDSTAVVVAGAFTLQTGLNVGRAQNFGTPTWIYTGRMAGDMRIWSSVRTAAQLLALRNYHAAGSEAGLVHAWPLDDIGGTRAKNVGTLNTAAVLDLSTNTSGGVTFQPGNGVPRPLLYANVDLSGSGYTSYSSDSPYKHFQPALAQPSNFSVALPVPALNGGTQTALGNIVINDLDEKRTSEANLDWLGVDLQVLLGKKTDPLYNFSPLVRGTAASLSRTMENITLIFRDAKFKLQRALQIKKYGGFGAAVRGAGTAITVTPTTTITPPAGSMTLEVRFRPIVHVLGFNDIAGWHASLPGDRAIHYHNSVLGKIFFLVRNDAGSSALLASQTILTAGQSYLISLVLDAPNNMAYGYINGVLEVQSTVTGTFNTVTGAFRGLANINGELDEVRIWSGVRTSDQINATLAAPLTGAEAGLWYYNGMDEGAGSTASPSVGSGAMTLTNFSWVGTLEGGAEIAGKPKPLAFGVRRQVAPILVDAQNGVYQFHDGTLQAITALRDSGDPITFGSNVSDIYASAPAAGTYNTCLAMGLARMGSAPVGIITGDIQGDNAGTGYSNTAPGIAQKVMLQLCGFSTSQMDTAALNAMAVAVPYTTGFYWDKEITREAALSEVFASIWAWWGPDRQSVITCGRTPNPSTAAPTVYIANNDPVDPTKGGRWGDDPAGLRVGEVRVLYRPYHTVLSTDQVAGTVSLATRTDYGKQFRLARAFDPNRSADADEIEIQTSIDSYTQALALANYILDIMKIDRRLVRRTLQRGILQYYIGTIMNLTVTRGGITTSKNYMVVKLAEQYGSGSTPDKVEVDLFG